MIGLRWCSAAGSTTKVSSGANTRSRRRGRRRWRPCAARPASSAGPVDIQRTTSARVCAAPPGLGPHRGQPQLQPRDAAPRGAEVAAVRALELERGRRVVGDDAVDDAVGQRLPQQRRWLAASRIGGQHLNSVAPSGISSAVEGQVVRAGLDREPAPPRALGGGDQRQRVGGRQVQRCARGRRSRGQRRSGARSRVSSAAARARGEEVGVRRAAARGGAASMSRGSSACTISSAAEAGDLAPSRRASCSGVQVRELVDARGQQEALEAEDARARAAAEVARGCRAPRRPRSRRRRAPGRGGRARLTSRAATVVVGGMLLSGMSTSVVTPPAAAAAGRGGEALPLGAARAR